MSSRNACTPTVEIVSHDIQIVTDAEVTTESYFPEVGNIPQGRRMKGIRPPGIFPNEG